MSQGDIGQLVPSETSGTELANRLRAQRDALHTMHSGASRPTYAQPGTLWLNTSGNPWIMNLWTGQVDVPIATVNPTTGVTSLYTKTEADARFVRADGGNTGPLAGFRNKIINPNGTINQRRASGGYTTGVYREDRWRGHANGKEQLIEQANAPAGAYTLSWAGGGTGRVNGSAAAASPITVQIAGTDNVSIVVPTGATAVQFEPGSVATPLEQRHPIIELMLCMAYYQKTFPQATTPAPNQGFDGAVIATAVGTVIAGTWSFAVPMRAIPSLTAYNPANDASPGWRNLASTATSSATIYGVTERCVVITGSSAVSNNHHGIHLIASAEIS